VGRLPFENHRAIEDEREDAPRRVEVTTPTESSESGVRFGQPSAAARPSPGFGLGGSVAGIVVVAALLGGFLWAGAARNVASAAHPKIFGGSLVLEDQRPPTVIDLASGKVTVRLQGIDTQVGASSYGDVQAVPVSVGTMLIDRRSGTFNLLGRDNYVVDAAGPGVGLGALAGLKGALGMPVGRAAYVVRFAPKSTVSLVDESTVLAGARLERGVLRQPSDVTPNGFADLGGPVLDQPGSAAVEPTSGDMWVLVGRGTGCDLLQLHQAPNARQGLLPSTRASFSASCARAAVEAVPGTVAVAAPGGIRLFTGGAPVSGRAVIIPTGARANGFLPVTGATGEVWFLSDSTTGWSVVGIRPSGRITGPITLGHFGPASRPATPAVSAGVLYTMDQAAAGQPELWRIFPDTGAMVPVQGQPDYPARGPTEKASFDGAQVVVDGPRVVFNNPGSLLAVVVFTDRSHSPVVVDKSAAVTVSATGPADLGIAPQPGATNTSPTTVAEAGQVPVVQPVSKQVTCATTTQKPYAPQITSVTVSSATALIAWSYELLDQADCEPTSWSARVTALGGAHQPDQPVQFVNGQNQLLFTGLRPATTYEVVVTAYINAQATPSSPTSFTTAARGPDAPVSAVTASDGSGDWVVSWTPCSASNCYVPADNWNVIGSACGSSYVGQPPTVQVPGNQTSVVINADSVGLLGDSLTFSVQGSLASGLLGGATPDHECTEAWRPPDRDFIALSGSGVQNGQTITATLRVSTSEPEVEAFGSANTLFVYQVGGITVGPTTATSVTIPGLAAGQTYVPSVAIYPAGQPQASVTVTGQPFSKNLSWPSNLSVSVQPSVDEPNPNQGNLQLSFANVPPGQMSASGSYVCGSTQGPHFGGPLNNGMLNVTMDLISMGGSCHLTATLSDQDSSVYGRPSDPLTAPFTIGTQPQYSFSAAIPQSCQQSFCLPQQIMVQASGTKTFDRGGDWKIVTKTQGSGGGGLADLCASSTAVQTPPSFPYTISLPSTCLDATKVDVSVSWMYLGVTSTDDAGTPTGTPKPPPTTTTTTPPTTTPPTTTPPTTTPPTTTTSTTRTIAPPPSSARKTGAAASTAAGLLVVAWCFRRRARSRPAVDKTKPKRTL
jgi:hypothetical protein